VKIYLSGPVSGLDYGEAVNRFAHAERLIRGLGHDPVNPLVIEPGCLGCNPNGDGKPHTYECYMKWDLIALLRCDAIVMLDGWARSRGSLHELATAAISGLVVFISVDHVWNVSATMASEQRG
jgi:hypothetical protein